MFPQYDRHVLAVCGFADPSPKSNVVTMIREIVVTEAWRRKCVMVVRSMALGNCYKGDGMGLENV